MDDASAGTSIRRDVVLARLRSAERELRSKGVAHVALFGSVARGEDRSDSDIDVMVDLEPDGPIGIFGFVEIANMIRDLLPGPVDVSDRESLRPFVRPSAERDAVYAF